MSGLLLRETEAFEIAEEYLRLQSEKGDLMRLLFSWALRMRGGEVRAEELLTQRWAELRPRMRSAGRRLTLGDSNVWNAMLVGYFVGEVPLEQILGPLRSEERLAGSALGGIEVPLTALRCEAYFYDALLQQVTGEPATRRDRHEAALKNALSTGYAAYVEYFWAAILLGRSHEKAACEPRE
jgi:hypothetical protein